jgi:uncharacterized membrane protein
MSQTASITILGERAEVERRWSEQEAPEGATVAFKDAPGDRGTEIHLALGDPGRLGGLVQKVSGGDARAKVKDELRRFKQQVETGVISRSDGSPEGELAERKLKQRPAQPLEDAEVEKVGA